MPKIPTVRIVHGDGFLKINESDYDPNQHTKYEGKIPESKPPSSSKINVNDADVTTLKTLPTVGVAMAKKIIEARETNPLLSLEDLKVIDGLNVDAIADLITF